MTAPNDSLTTPTPSDEHKGQTERICARQSTQERTT